MWPHDPDVYSMKAMKSTASIACRTSWGGYSIRLRGLSFLQPGQNMTGPSLADVWNRKAGSLAGFSRYSPALKSANIVWNDKTLDDWINDPQHVVPGNQMTFAGIKDTRQRADLLAFLKDATQKGAAQTAQ
jgi:cytochrome c